MRRPSLEERVTRLETLEEANARNHIADLASVTAILARRILVGQIVLATTLSTAAIVVSVILHHYR